MFGRPNGSRKPRAPLERGTRLARQHISRPLQPQHISSQNKPAKGSSLAGSPLGATAPGWPAGTGGGGGGGFSAGAKLPNRSSKFPPPLAPACPLLAPAINAVAAPFSDPAAGAAEVVAAPPFDIALLAVDFVPAASETVFAAALGPGGPRLTPENKSSRSASPEPAPAPAPCGAPVAGLADGTGAAADVCPPPRSRLLRRSSTDAPPAPLSPVLAAAPAFVSSPRRSVIPPLAAGWLGPLPPFEVAVPFALSRSGAFPPLLVLPPPPPTSNKSTVS